MAKMNIAQQVTQIISDTVVGMGYILWDVEYAKQGADYHLTITIDKADGITINDCEAVHRAIDPLLDEADPIETAYYLDVSSPGIERELRTDAHILASIGQTCEVKLFAAVNGHRTFKGELLSYQDGVVKLLTPEGEVSLQRSAISKMNTVYFD
ncbi:MAG: ribosome maturation factor RimP [Clostridia bacterium]|nr:ribosome maturation factor RimP [Clostridia bacterium]